jgi:hypothetical protein
VYDPAGNLVIEKYPLTSVCAPKVVPLRITDVNITGSADSDSYTKPLMFPF